MTTDNTKLSDIFKSNEDVNKQTKKFVKTLNGIIHQCFKKVKITNTFNKEIDELFKQQKVLKNKEDHESKMKLKEVEEKLADKMSEDMYKTVKEEVDKVDSETGGFNSGHLWKLKSKLRPKFNDYPTAFLNSEGKMITSEDEIKQVTIDHFKKVLEDRPIKEGLEEHKKQREKLCQIRVQVAKTKKTARWELEDVQFVIKN